MRLTIPLIKSLGRQGRCVVCGNRRTLCRDDQACIVCHAEHKVFVQMRIPFPEPCSHCGGPVIIVQDGLNTTTCMQCKCVWSSTRVLNTKGFECRSEETVFVPVDNVRDPVEVLKRL